jgi:LPS sulfotransferase NodH
VILISNFRFLLSKQVEIRGSIRYSIKTKESRSIDRAENIKSWTQGILTRKSSWNQYVGEPGLILKPVRITYWEISSSSTGSTRNQDQLSFVNDPDFQSMFHVREQVTKFLLISYRKSDWKTRLIRNHNWPGSGSGIWYTNIN